MLVLQITWADSGIKAQPSTIPDYMNKLPLFFSLFFFSVLIMVWFIQDAGHQHKQRSKE